MHSVFDPICQWNNGYGCRRVYDPGMTPSELIRGLVRHDVAIESVFKRAHSLEEYFMNLMKGDGDDA